MAHAPGARYRTASRGPSRWTQLIPDTWPHSARRELHFGGSVSSKAILEPAGPGRAGRARTGPEGGGKDQIVQSSKRAFHRCAAGVWSCQRTGWAETGRAEAPGLHVLASAKSPRSYQAGLDPRAAARQQSERLKGKPSRALPRARSTYPFFRGPFVRPCPGALTGVTQGTFDLSVLSRAFLSTLPGCRADGPRPGPTRADRAKGRSSLAMPR